MAIAATQVWNGNGAAANDNGGGGFDPAQTAGMYSDLNCTLGTGNSPVVTSASINFAAGDAGHWLYIASGTNWIPGWYLISSVALNAATLQAAIGTARMAYNQSTGSYAGANGSLNTTAGCSSTATNTNGATFSIDRSFSTAIFKSGSTGAVSGSNLTPNAYTVVKTDAGNTVQITSGTGVTASWYTIKSISGSAWVLDRAPGGSGSDIAWNMGGALQTLGQLGNVLNGASTGISGQRAYLTGTSSMSATTNNVSGGTFNPLSSHAFYFEGYGTVPGDLLGPPVVDAGAQTGMTIVTLPGTAAVPQQVVNLMLNGKGNATVNGFSVTSSAGSFTGCYALNFNGSGTTTGFVGSGGTQLPASRCYAGLCGVGFSLMTVDSCEADGCTTGFSGIIAATFAGARSISHNNSGAGVSITVRNQIVDSLVSYANGSHGIDSSGTTDTRLVNSVSYGNTGNGVKTSSTDLLFNVATGTNSSGRTQTGANSPQYDPLAKQILLTADPYANLNGGSTVKTGTNLTVDGSNNLLVTPDSYTPWASDVGLKLLILPATGWTAGVYTITAQNGTAWTLDRSPAAVTTASGIWRISDFRPNNVAGGGALLRGTILGCLTQADKADIGAAQHQDTGPVGKPVMVASIGTY